jgi:phosphoglycerate dehydrogenase-like enzyme
VDNNVGEKKLFRIGITPDFATQVQGAIDPGIDEVLRPAPGIEWEFMPDTGGVADPEILNRYDAAIVLDYRFPAESFRGVQRLAVLARWGVGFDRIDVPACTEASVILAVTPDSVARPVAEGALGLMFALAKNFRTHDINCRAGRWREQAPIGFNLQGKTLGAVGLGNIGRELFGLARGVGFRRLLAYEPIAPNAEEAAAGVEFIALDAVMRESDFISIHCPLNDQTRGMIGAPQFALMKPTAYLINTARGPIVDEAALRTALSEHKIAGAAIDVYETEPVRPDNPLLKLENALFSPHVIARTHEGIRDTSVSACRSVVSVSKGAAPPYIVNRQVLERPAMREKLARYQS